MSQGYFSCIYYSKFENSFWCCELCVLQLASLKRVKTFNSCFMEHDQHVFTATHEKLWVSQFQIVQSKNVFISRTTRLIFHLSSQDSAATRPQGLKAEMSSCVSSVSYISDHFLSVDSAGSTSWSSLGFNCDRGVIRKCWFPSFFSTIIHLISPGLHFLLRPCPRTLATVACLVWGLWCHIV